jgi:CheY-like chemotaxis protein
VDVVDGQPVLIMLIEDNLDHAELVMRHLRDHRVSTRIIHLRDGEAALRYLMRQAEYGDPAASPRPHFVLLDLRLPKVDGIDVLRQIKESEDLRHIPVVVLTTSAAQRDVAHAYARYANSYVVKPVDYTQFRALMEGLVNYWGVLNITPKME